MQRIANFLDRVAKEEGDHGTPLLQSVLENLDDAAFVVDLPIRQILWCNPAAHRIFGYDSDELIGADTRKLHVNERHYEDFGRQTQPVVRRGEPFRGRFWMQRKNGARFPTDHVITPVHDVHGKTLVVSMVDDLTHEEARLGHKLPGFERLSERERQVLDCTLRGLSAKEAARKLDISPRTVEQHRSSILDKLEVRSVAQLMSELLSAAGRSGEEGGQPPISQQTH